jgi:hypothetical protein
MTKFLKILPARIFIPRQALSHPLGFLPLLPKTAVNQISIEKSENLLKNLSKNTPIYSWKQYQCAEF